MIIEHVSSGIYSFCTFSMIAKRCLLLGRKVMTNLDSILKSRDITLSTKVHLVKAVVFPVVMYGCESWTIKKAECQRIDAFELWSWRRLLRVPWAARRSNRGIDKVHSRPTKDFPTQPMGQCQGIDDQDEGGEAEQRSQPMYLKGDQPWVFIRRTDVEAETPILWPPHAKS